MRIARARKLVGPCCQDRSASAVIGAACYSLKR
jgi:hypothetical protein